MGGSAARIKKKKKKKLPLGEIGAVAPRETAARIARDRQRRAAAAANAQQLGWRAPLAAGAQCVPGI
jgi:hypothetical protein